jgi:Flavodoxins
MNIRVFYWSKTGNTKKVAETMADVLGCQAESILSDPEPVSADILFLGAAVYATFNHEINPAVSEFIGRLDPTKIGKVILFCTGFADTAVKTMSGLLKKKGIPFAEDSFFCKGKMFLFFNFGHPNGTDIENAKRFAKTTIMEKR